MRLKTIKLAGFKSFVDPTSVNLPSNLCAVVGPNGCGKSNIIDAVRWVMGESSAKNLRGEAMTDVIFNGSGTRKPVGQASIELIFDNTENRIQGEYGRFAEISIKRKVTRDGQGTYMLNGTKCRRRDITDIFLGTGLGPRSYSIIEQGMISRLIESRPEELRVFIEEAAGISKYKERRRDTENRIRRTRENLERLTDIREELERQLQHLHRQAQAAEKYAEFKARERDLAAQLGALRWRALDEQVQSRQKEINELELKMESTIAAQRAVGANIETQFQQQTVLNDVLSQVQGRYYSLGNEVARLEQSIEHHRERMRQLRQDLQTTREDWSSGQQELDEDRRRVQSLDAELSTLGTELELARQLEEESALQLEEAEAQMAEWQHQWEAFSRRSEEPRQVAEVEQSRIQQLERIVERGIERRGRLREERAALGENPEQARIDELSLQIAETEQVVEQQQSQSEQLAAAIDQQRQQSRELSAALDQARSTLQTQKGRHASLEALQHAALGRDNKALNRWLEQEQLAGNPRLAEGVQVTPGWETAVEAVLGDTLQAVCVEDLQQVSALLDSMPDGIISLLDTGADVPAAAVVDDLQPLTTKVQAAQSVSALLAGIYVTENLSEALQLRSRLPTGASLVTRQGVWLGANWLRLRKAVDETAGLLARKGELTQLEDELAVSRSRVEMLDQQLEDCRQHLHDLEAERESVQRLSSQYTRQLTELKSQLTAHLTREEENAQRRRRLEQEISELERQLSVEQDNTASARERLQQALDSMEQDVERREQLLQQRDDTRNVLDQCRQKARHDKDHAHDLSMREQLLQSQLRSLGQTIERMTAQEQRAAERIRSIEVQLAGGDGPLDENQALLEEKLHQRLAEEEALAQAKARADDNDHQLRNLEQQRSQHEREASTLREALMEKRLRLEGDSVKRQGFEEQLRASQYDLSTVLQNLPQELTVNSCEEELGQLAQRIQRLGAINLAAIDEYQQQSERKTYLDAQNEELEKALQTLENAIRKIDKETRTRFKETFDQINQGLQELFPKVFGGGHAYLDMTGEDLLDTGVAIMARPPGKKNSTIHLLSGGEKAMTAIALVFSIFRLNPSPFCMLDEVDAPLDDANTARYSRLVREMSASVQFIFITHNKLTMESANQLLGVTMHEPGVSRIVAVDIDEATELAAM